MQYSCIIYWLILPLKRRFRDSQIVITTNFVVESGVDIKKVVCMYFYQSYKVHKYVPKNNDDFPYCLQLKG